MLSNARRALALKNSFLAQQRMLRCQRTMLPLQCFRGFSRESNSPFAEKSWSSDTNTISEPASISNVTPSVTQVDADRPINFPPIVADTFSISEEPRFLEQVQLFVDKAASKTDVKADMLKYIMACDHVLRFQIPVKRDNGMIETLTCYRA